MVGQGGAPGSKAIPILGVAAPSSVPLFLAFPSPLCSVVCGCALLMPVSFPARFEGRPDKNSLWTDRRVSLDHTAPPWQGAFPAARRRALESGRTHRSGQDVPGRVLAAALGLQAVPGRAPCPCHDGPCMAQPPLQKTITRQSQDNTQDNPQDNSKHVTKWTFGGLQ